MVFNYSMENLTGATDFVGIIKYANEVTGDMFGVILLFIVFMVFFGGSANAGASTERSFVFAMFVTTISGWLLYAIGLISVGISIMLFVLLLIGVFIVGRSKDQ